MLFIEDQKNSKIGNTAIPSELGTTITGAIANLDKTLLWTNPDYPTNTSFSSSYTFDATTVSTPGINNYRYVHFLTCTNNGGQCQDPLIHTVLTELGSNRIELTSCVPSSYDVRSFCRFTYIQSNQVKFDTAYRSYVNANWFENAVANYSVIPLKIWGSN